MSPQLTDQEIAQLIKEGYSDEDIVRANKQLSQQQEQVAVPQEPRPTGFLSGVGEGLIESPGSLLGSIGTAVREAITHPIDSAKAIAGGLYDEFANPLSGNLPVDLMNVASAGFGQPIAEAIANKGVRGKYYQNASPELSRALDAASPNDYDYGKEVGLNTGSLALSAGGGYLAGKASRGIARNAPRRAEELQASIDGITESDITRSMKEGGTVTKDQYGGTTRETPVLDSYRKVRDDGGFGSDPLSTIAEWEGGAGGTGKIDAIAGDINAIVKAADAKNVATGTPQKFAPSLRSADDVVNAMTDINPADKMAARQYVISARNTLSKGGTLEYLQNQKRAIYQELSDRAYSRPDGSPVTWMDKVQKAIASDIKKTIEDSVDAYIPQASGRVRQLNELLGAYYDQLPILRRNSAKGFGQAVSSDAVKGAATGAGIGTFAGAGAVGGGVGAVALPLLKSNLLKRAEIIGNKIIAPMRVIGGSEGAAIGGLNALSSRPETNISTGDDANLSTMMDGPPGFPNMNTPLPRDWKLLKHTQGGLEKVAMLAAQAGVQLPDPDSMSDQEGNQLLTSLTQIAPHAFEKTPDGYKSVVGSSIKDPIEQDMHKSAAKDLPATQRALTIGGLYNDKYVPLNTQPPTPTPTPPPIDALGALSRLGGASPSTQVSANMDLTDTEKMLATLRASINYA